MWLVHSKQHKDFWCGQVIPICAGWFGEIDEGFEIISNSLHKRRLQAIMGWQYCHWLIPTGKEGRIISCYNSLKEPFAWQQFREMHNTNSHDYTTSTSEQHHKKQQQHAKQTTAIIDGVPMADQAGSQQHAPEGYGTFEKFREQIRSLCALVTQETNPK